MKIIGAHKSRSLRRQRGLTLIESALVLAVAAITMGFFVRMLADNAEVMKAKGVSEKMVEVFDAAGKYVKVNNAALVAAIPSGSQMVILAGKPSATGAVPSGPTGSLPSLQGGGFLTPGFIDRNSYNQRHALIIRNVNVAGLGQRLDSIVTTYSGTKIPDRQLQRIAGFLGASGGYVPKTPQAADAGQIVGSYGGWRSPRAAWGSTSNPDEGSVVATLAFESGEDSLAPYLYRMDIGKAEANRMRTNIDMFSNDINAVRTITGGGPAGELTIDSETRVTKDIRGGIDIWADRNIIAGRNISAGNDIAAANDITAGRNIVANKIVQGENVTATQTVTGTNVIANQDVTARRNLQVGNNANVVGRLTSNDLNTQYLDVSNTKIYGLRGLVAGHGVTLESLLPRQIAMYSYFVQNGEWVPKPSCPVNHSARIMLFRQQDSNRSIVSFDGYADGGNGMYASDYGGIWYIFWGGGFGPAAGIPRTAIAQTYCVYG
jgi:hypothetical protein